MNNLHSNSYMSVNMGGGMSPLAPEKKNAWGGFGQDSLLGMATSLFAAEAMQGRPFPPPPPMMSSLFPGQRPARPEDITSQVLAELADDTLFDPPSDDIFDMEPVPLPTREQNRRNLLEDTLNQVLSIENIFMDDEQVNVPQQVTPVPTPSAAIKREAPEPMMDMMMPSNKRQCVEEEDEDDAGRRFRPYQAEQWSEKFEELLQFRKERGHCCVPHTFDENPSLARWVKRQRYQYKLKAENKPSTMTDERIVALEQAGFVWDSHGAAWLERWQELVEYQQENGHANVPSNHPQNPQLATWVKCQRRQYKLFWDGKPSNMNLERIQRLESVGFEWELRASHKKPKAAAGPQATASAAPIQPSMSNFSF